MSLIKNTTPAERSRGCIFSETFESKYAVERNEGTVVGTPVIDFGATFNGTTDYIQYTPWNGTMLNSDELSFVLEFTPHFDWDYADAAVTLWDIRDNANGNSSNLIKNGINERFEFYISGSYIGAWDNALFENVWKINERNVLVVSTKSGDTELFLNGTLISNSKPSAWTPNALTTKARLASDVTTPRYFFDGVYHSFKIFQSKLTQQEVLDFYNNSTYTYRNKAVVDLPMTAECHDPDNVRTLDKSGNGHHATFGDGSTPTKYPAKLSKHGYSFDGTTDYMTMLDNANLRTSKITVIALINKDEYTDSQSVIIQSGDPTDYSTFNWSIENLADSIVFNGRTGFFSGVVPVRGLITVGFQADNDNSVTNIICNGEIVQTHADRPVGTDNTTPVSIGKKTGTSGRDFHGSIKQIFITGDFLTSLQLKDLHINLMKKVNEV